MVDVTCGPGSDCEDDMLKEIEMETIGATWKQLVTVFGKPDGLTWTIQFANGTRAVIYSMSKEPKTRIREWNVTGDDGALAAVKASLALVQTRIE